ncbi:MAG: glycosyltransferase family 4 protein, partial [Dehalococcoidia bacterium]
YEGTFLLNALATSQPSRPQMVIGVVPSLSGGVLAAAAAARYRVPFGLIFQDLMGPAAGQSGIAGGGRVMRVTGALENRIAARAAGVAIIAEGFRPYLEAGGVEPDRIWRVRNWTHIGEPTESRRQTRARLGFSPGELVCLHAGNMGLKQGLENVVACARLALTEAPAMRFVLMGDGNQRTALMALAEGLPNVRFLPPQPERDFSDVLAAADVLLVNQRHTVQDMSLPGKLTSYFAAGRPTVAAVAPTSETATELTAAGAGLVVEAERPEALLAALCRVAASPDLAAMQGERGRAYARQHLTPDAALARFEQFLDAVAHHPRRRTDVRPARRLVRATSRT